MGLDQNASARLALVDVIVEPLVDGKICCPFHDNSTPSLHVYEDHFHCFGCGAHGTAIDYLMMVEGWTATRLLRCWRKPAEIAPALFRSLEPPADSEAKRQRALELWEHARPLEGTLAERYLAETRRIDLTALPNASASRASIRAARLVLGCDTPAWLRCGATRSATNR